MLAQSFKTPAKLNISDAQFDALVKTLAYLEQEKIEYIKKYKRTGFLYLKQCATDSFCLAPVPKKQFFNLNEWNSETNCGTVMCIGGTAEWLAGDELLFTGLHPWSAHRGLSALFSPTRITMRKVQVHQAARALRNYLTHGHPYWSKVMKET